MNQSVGDGGRREEERLCECWWMILKILNPRGTGVVVASGQTCWSSTSAELCRHRHVTPQRPLLVRRASAYTHTLTHTQPWSVHSLLSLPSLFAHPIHQEPSLRLVPAKAPVKASVSDTANSLGLHDTLKYGPRNLADEIKSTNPLQARLENVRHSMPCAIISAK
jgi:hypothetical protein